MTPAGFAAAVPELAAYPLPAVSHALALLRTTAVAVLDAPQPDGGPAVYVIAPSHVLLVDAVRDDDPHTGRHVRLPAPLGGSAVGVPVPGVPGLSFSPQPTPTASSVTQPERSTPHAP